MTTATTRYYVTMREPGPNGRVAFLLGPFAEHGDALALVQQAAKLADDVAPGSWFNEFGTTAVTAETHKPGVLNDRLRVAAGYVDTSDASIARNMQKKG